MHGTSMVLALALALLGACDTERAQTDSRGQQELPPHAVVGLTKLPQETADWADSLLDRISVDSDRQGRVLSGELLSLAGPGAAKRLLFVGSNTPFGKRDEVVLVLFAEDLPGSMSEPWSTGIDYDEYNFEPVGAVDADEDGMLDFAYCTWPGDTVQGKVDIVGFKNGWYEIDPSVTDVECGAQASP